MGYTTSQRYISYKAESNTRNFLKGKDEKGMWAGMQNRSFSGVATTANAGVVCVMSTTLVGLLMVRQLLLLVIQK